MPEPNIRVLISTSALLCCVQDGLHDLLVAGAAAQVSLQAMPHLGLSGIGIPFQQ
jgi:hypothetical protein